MRIACVTYRDWALKIYNYLKNHTDHEYLIIGKKEHYKESLIRKFNPDYVLFYGWSWIVDERTLDDFQCIMLHPSPLPKYRGGSPIQNQIEMGETNSMVSLFKMNNELDAGDIYCQSKFSLEGSLDDIFCRIVDLGIELTLNILHKNIIPISQDHSKATYFKRRKPSDSEITIQDLKNKTGLELYNKVRMLEDPYPNAFIKLSDGSKLMIKKAVHIIDGN